MHALEIIKKDIEQNGVSRYDVYDIENIAKDNFITSSIILEDFSRTKTTLYKNEVLQKLESKITEYKESSKNLLNPYYIKILELKDKLKLMISAFEAPNFDLNKLSFYINIQYMYADKDGKFLVLDDNTTFINLLDINPDIHGEYKEEAIEFFYNNEDKNKRNDSIVIILKKLCELYKENPNIFVNKSLLNEQKELFQKDNLLLYNYYTLTISDLKFIKDEYILISEILRKIHSELEQLLIDVNDVTKIYKRKEYKELLNSLIDFSDFIMFTANNSNLKYFINKCNCNIIKQ